MDMYKLKFILLSDATFGRGDGVVSLVNAEVEHDRYGLPYLRGRTLKGLLAEAYADIRFALQQSPASKSLARWDAAARILFGDPGSKLKQQAQVHIGDACLPADLRSALAADMESESPTHTADAILNSLTAIRRQTAMDVTGKPEAGSLRAMRVVLRGVIFESQLRFVLCPDADILAILAACSMGMRRLGTGRNRGRGHVLTRLYDAEDCDITLQHFEHFEKEVKQ
ncbi:MAG: hypothetical protein JXR84_28495 [Anaerolineae bacterium]|nr:hypothetical protein [Anaerolineae bacterium]